LPWVKRLWKPFFFLREQIKRSPNGWLPSGDWTFIKQEWDCIVYIERNLLPGHIKLPKHLTYRDLLNTVVGLWGAMFVKDLFFGVDFDIYDKRWGLVGMGSRTPWNISNRILDSS